MRELGNLAQSAKDNLLAWLEENEITERSEKLENAIACEAAFAVPAHPQDTLRVAMEMERFATRPVDDIFGPYGNPSAITLISSHIYGYVIRELRVFVNEWLRET